MCFLELMEFAHHVRDVVFDVRAIDKILSGLEMFICDAVFVDCALKIIITSLSRCRANFFEDDPDLIVISALESVVIDALECLCIVGENLESFVVMCFCSFNERQTDQRVGSRISTEG